MLSTDAKAEPLLSDDGHTSAPHLIPPWLEPWIGRLYVLAGVFFVVGSICFLPEFEEWYLDGCIFYFAGGAIYLLTSSYDLAEVWSSADGGFDRAMNELYVCGSVIYLVGTAFYLPGAPMLLGRKPTEIGAWCFIVGSLFFIHACFVNGAHTGDAFAAAERRDDEHASKILRSMKVYTLVTTNCTMLGSAAFLVGSVLYLPTIGCDEFAVCLLLLRAGLIRRTVAPLILSRYPGAMRHVALHRRLVRLRRRRRAAAGQREAA